MPDRYSVHTVFKAHDQTSRVLRKMTNSVGSFANKTESALRKVSVRTKKLQSGMQSFTRTLGTTGLALGYAGGRAAQTGMDFEQLITGSVARLSQFGDSQDDITKKYGVLSKVAVENAKVTEFTSSEVASSMDVMTKAGIKKTDTLIGMTDRMMDFASAVGVDVAQATDRALDGVGMLGLRSEDTDKMVQGLNRTTNLMAKAINASNQGLEDLFFSMKGSAPIFRQANADLEEYFTLNAALANVGIKGTDAATALKRVTLAITTPAERGAMVFKGLNVQFTEMINGVKELRPATAVLKDLFFAIEKLDPADRIKAYEMLFGKVGIAGGINLTKSFTGEFQRLHKIMNEDVDKVSFLASITRGTTGRAFLRLKSAVEGLVLGFYDLNRVELTAVFEEWAKFMNQISDDDKTMKTWGNRLKWVISNLDTMIITFTGLVAAVAGLWVFNQIVLAVPIAIMAWKTIVLPVLIGVGHAIIWLAGILTAPIWLITALFVAIGTLAYGLYKYHDDLVWFFSDLKTTIPQVLDYLLGEFKKFADGFYDLVVSPVESAIALLAAFGNEQAQEHLVAIETRKNEERGQSMIGRNQQNRTGVQGHGESSSATATLDIRDHTGKAQIRTVSKGPGAKIRLTPTGGMDQ